MKKPALYILLLAFALIGCDSSENSNQNGSQEALTEEELVQYQSCESANDCGLAENGCNCDFVAINKDQQDAFDANFECVDDPNSACVPPDMYPSPAVPTCVDNLCGYTF